MPLDDWLVTLSIGAVVLVRAHSHSENDSLRTFYALMAGQPPTLQPVMSIAADLVRDIVGGWQMSPEELSGGAHPGPPPPVDLRTTLIEMLERATFDGAAALAEQARSVDIGHGTDWFRQLVPARVAGRSTFDKGIPPIEAAVPSIENRSLLLWVEDGYLAGCMLVDVSG
jgi:hypothetical protein